MKECYVHFRKQTIFYFCILHVTNMLEVWIFTRLTIPLHFSCQRFSMHPSVRHPQWSISLHRASFHHLNFPFILKVLPRIRQQQSKKQNCIFSIIKQNLYPSAASFTFVYNNRVFTWQLKDTTFTDSAAHTSLRVGQQSWHHLLRSRLISWAAVTVIMYGCRR